MIYKSNFFFFFIWDRERWVFLFFSRSIINGLNGFVFYVRYFIEGVLEVVEDDVEDG